MMILMYKGQFVIWCRTSYKQGLSSTESGPSQKETLKRKSSVTHSVLYDWEQI